MEEVKAMSERCGWAWTHWMGGDDPRHCELPFGHDGMHRLFDRNGRTMSAAPAGFHERKKR